MGIYNVSNKDSNRYKKIIKITSCEAHVLIESDGKERDFSPNTIDAFSFAQKTLIGESVVYVSTDSLSKFNRCSYCDCPLTILYMDIIRMLKEAGLLNEDFKPLCCFCYDKQKKGGVDAKNK